MFVRLGLRGLFVSLVWLAFASGVSAQECIAYCICNGEAGRVTDSQFSGWCSEICGGGGGGFLVHGEEEVPALLRSAMDPKERARRARLADWALVEVEMFEGRRVTYEPLYGSSNTYAMEAAATSEIEAYLHPGFTTRIFLKERPPGSVPQEPTVDQDGLRTHLLGALGDQFLALEGAKMSFAIVLGLDGQVESIQILYAESEAFAKILIPELRNVYSTYSGHQGNGRTLDVFSPNIHSEGHKIGFHHGGSFLLDVHPFQL